ncbi:hypothetical protein [Pumilibacter intestinalis]|uniref:hypothetical protein n=1 Tax=Pumilibacter intestinalis TaxID=2941511 RepID=UPI0020407478|nr:hypothetical protein [Pumilibacter intestinalis]
MSRPFREKNKDLVKLEVVAADKVWTKNKSGKSVLRKDIEIFGRVDKGTSAFVTTTNLSGGNHKVIEDTCRLPKRVKNDIVKLLKSNNRKVAYLIRTDKK